MKQNLAIFSLFLSLLPGLYAMEQEQSTQKTINLKLSEGQVSLPEGIALHSSLIRGCLDYAEAIGDSSLLIDFSDRHLFMRDNDDSDEKEKIHNLLLDPKIVRAVFDCVIHGKKSLHALSHNELITVFEVADYLGISQKTMRKLTRYIQKNVMKDEQPRLVQISHYCNSIRTLYRNNELQVILKEFNLHSEKNECQPYRLILKSQKIDTLDGIEELAKKYEKVYIQEICLDKNLLKALNIAQLLKNFPSLNVVSAKNNRIEKLILPEALPADFKLIVKNNNIKEFPPCKLGENCYIDLRDNLLSDVAQENAQGATRPTFMEINRPLVNTLFHPDAFKNGLLVFGITVPACIGGGVLGLCAYKYFSGSSVSIMNMAKDIMAQEQLFVGFLAAVTLGTVGFNWYAKYFKAHYEGESTWNAYQTPRIDYDRTEQK